MNLEGESSVEPRRKLSSRGMSWKRVAVSHRDGRQIASIVPHAHGHSREKWVEASNVDTIIRVKLFISFWNFWIINRGSSSPRVSSDSASDRREKESRSSGLRSTSFYRFTGESRAEAKKHSGQLRFPSRDHLYRMIFVQVYPVFETGIDPSLKTCARLHAFARWIGEEGYYKPRAKRRFVGCHLEIAIACKIYTHGFRFTDQDTLPSFIVSYHRFKNANIFSSPSFCSFFIFGLITSVLERNENEIFFLPVPSQIWLPM